MAELCYLTIIVSDLGRSVDFYRELGFEEIEIGDTTNIVGIIHLKRGSMVLQLLGGVDVAGHIHTNSYSVGMNDFGISVDSAEDTLRDLIRKGITSEDTEIMDPGDGLRFFKLEDPNGALIAIMEDKRKITKTS